MTADLANGRWSSTATPARKSLPLIELIDPPLVICSLLLLTIGFIMVSSASIAVADQQLHDPFYFTRRHISYIGLGLILAWLLLPIRLVFWERASRALAVLALLLLLIVLLPGVGRTVNGATRWLNLGIFSLQVAEPARLFLIIYMAGYLVRHRTAVQGSFAGLFKPMIILGPACAMILLQPDFGATVVLLITIAAMLFLAGVPLWRFFLLAGSGLLMAVLLALASPYRMQRLTAFMDPWADPFDTGFQLTQSLIAFGSGGWFGVGLGNSVQKLFYLPEAHNDFLLAILAEELGLLGIGVLLAIFLVLLSRIFKIAAAAERQQQLFAATMTYGLGCWLAIQAMINIGVNMGVLPTKGLTLPLVSAGGSSLLIMCVVLALVQRVDIEVKLAQSQVTRHSQSANKSQSKRSD